MILLEETAGDPKSIQGLNNTQDTRTHAEYYHIFSLSKEENYQRWEKINRTDTEDKAPNVLSFRPVNLLFNQKFKKEGKISRQDDLNCRLLFLPAMVEIPRVTPMESSICVPWRTDENRGEQTQWRKTSRRRRLDL